MYKVTWDKNSNGILLVDHSSSDVISPPRPVFFEELDLLGFNKFWSYPKTQEPLLWAIGRKYYYKGEFVAEAKGGNIFEAPKIVLTEKGQNLELEPINIEDLIEKNKKALFVLENEALDFIEHTYKVYKKKKYIFAVSYSGGKDSQVVLDLVTRVIPPDDLVVIFSDTTMEISYTYENVAKTKEYYEKRYPGLKFYIARPPKPAIEFWKDFGPPSRIHRWCCTVTKSVPFIRLIKNLLKENENKLPNILTFDGVRAEESNKRNQYLRLAKGVKHLTEINAEVIQEWNSTEVFLYLFLRGIELNKGYRYGLGRIGCMLCPFGSPFNEYIYYKINKRVVKNYIEVLKSYAETLGYRNDKVFSFISQGKWKSRTSSNGLRNKHFFKTDTGKDENKYILNLPRENFLEWIKVAGDILYKKENGRIVGELKIANEIFSFDIDKENNRQIIKFKNIGKDIIARSKIKKVLYKTTYCVHCGACEAECPTGALKVIPKVKVNTDLCVHCGNCLNFVSKGCLVAKSISTIYGGKKMMSKIKNFGRYFKFGFLNEWLISYLNEDNWIENNNLGPKQFESFVRWLKDAEIILTKNSNKSQLYSYFRSISKNTTLLWSFILTNLYYNSNVINWYIDNNDWGTILSKKELINTIIKKYDGAEGTVNNGVLALFKTFEKTPLGNELKIGIIEKRGKERYVKKIGTDDIHPLAVAYSLYKAAEHIGRRDFTVSELYSKEFKGGPYKLFGVSREKLERTLRGLQEDKEQILRVDLVADLDNIYLRDDISSLDIVKITEVRLK